MNVRLIPLLLLTLLLFAPTLSQEMLVTKRQTTLLEEAGMSLNSDRKEKLNQVTGRAAYANAVHLEQNTLLKVVKKEPFTHRVTVVSQGVQSQKKRDFQAAYVEVANGPNEGKKGWIVISVQDEGRSATTYAGPPPSNYQATQTAQANATQQSDAQQSPTLPDLQVTVSKATRTGQVEIAGKKVYSVSVANAGGAPTPRNVTVTVKVGGKVIKTERIRNALPPQGSHRFAVEVSDSAVRRGEQLVVEVDSEKIVEEANESNNTSVHNL